MQFTKSSLLLGALACTSFVAAQFQNQSAPFNLVVRSTNATLDGSVLYACHEGAAIESLCPLYSAKLGTEGNISLPHYYFNYSDSDTVAGPIGTPGYLLWPLTYNLNQTVLEGLQLGAVVNPLSNVVTPLFYPSDQGLQEVAFDECNKLNIQGYVDDTTDPLTFGPTIKAYYRWYICTTFAGYTYPTLAWTLGNAPPENPTCQKVDVTRVFT